MTDDRRRRRRPTESPAWIGERSTSRRAGASRTALATTWMIGSVLARARARSSSSSFYVVSQGHLGHQLGFLTKDIPIITQLAGRRHRARDRRHAGASRGVAALMAVPLGVLAAIYLNEYGGQQPTATRDPVHGRRHDRRAVDRDGPVRRDDLGERRAAPRLLDASPASLALACLMLPIVIRSSEEMLKLVPDDLRQASDALGARRWRTVMSRGAPGRARRHRERRDARGRPRRGRDRAAAVHDRHLTDVQPEPVQRARTPRCRSRSGTTRRQPFAAAQDRAWGAALTLIVHRVRAAR